jgi:oligogalacturonide lyase
MSNLTAFPDPLTGHRIRRLTEGGVNVSPYFNSYAWTPEGDAVFYLRWEEGGKRVMACEVETGRSWPVAGPFPPEETQGATTWPTLNAIPGARAVSFVADGAVWRADLAGEAVRLTDLPPGDCDIGDTDVSGDGRRHVLGCIRMTEAARREAPAVWWPPDEFYARHCLRTLVLRVDLNTGALEELWEEPAVVDHISVNPLDPDLILYCHEGAIPYQYGRMFLRRVTDSTSRPVRDQRSGRVRVTHERWFADGQRIAYHGQYLPDPPDSAAPVHYVGMLDVARDLPQEYLLSDPTLAAWHSSPSPDGGRLAMDHQAGEQGLFLLELDRAGEVWQVERLTSLASDASEVHRDQWHELDPIWSPDGKRVLFRVVQGGESNLYVVEVG